MEFGSLLTSSPNQDRFSVCLTPSSNSPTQPRLTLVPCQPSKKIHTFLQWLSAFNIFVAIFSEKFPNETPRLMKYSEIVRDISTKPGDWYFYDEQFRYITIIIIIIIIIMNLLCANSIRICSNAHYN